MSRLDMPPWGKVWLTGAWALFAICTTLITLAGDAAGQAGPATAVGYFEAAQKTATGRQLQVAPTGATQNSPYPGGQQQGSPAGQPQQSPPSQPQPSSPPAQPQQGSQSGQPQQSPPGQSQQAPLPEPQVGFVTNMHHMRALLAPGQNGQSNNDSAPGQQSNNPSPGQQNGSPPAGQQNSNPASEQQHNNAGQGQRSNNTATGQQIGNAAPGQQNQGQQNETATQGQPNVNSTQGQQNVNANQGQQNVNADQGQQNGDAAPGQQNNNTAPGQQKNNTAPGNQHNNAAPGQSKQVTIDYNASILNSTLQLDGELLQTRIQPSATYPVPATLWHRINMVVVTADGAPISSPAKAPRLTLTLKTGTSPEQVVKSQWSQSKQSCVLQFRLTAAGNYTAILQLAAKSPKGPPAGVTTEPPAGQSAGQSAGTPAEQTGNGPPQATVATFAFSLDVYDMVAAPTTSNISLISNGSLVGSYVYVVAALCTAPVSGYSSGRPVHNTKNVNVRAIGSLSGQASIGNLVRYNDGTWSARFLLKFEESVEFELKVGGQLASSTSLNVSGYSATYDSRFSALGSAEVLLGTEQKELKDDLEMKTTFGQVSQLQLPVAALNASVSDPELAVAVLYQPVDPEVTLVTRYKLGITPQASSNASAPSNSTTSNTTGADNATVPDPGNDTAADSGSALLEIDYYDDYAEEPVDLSALMPIQYPDPSYTFLGAASVPAAAGTASASLWDSSAKWIGAFEPANARYSIQLTPPEPHTYSATLLARNPNTTAEHLMASFFLTARDTVTRSTAPPPAQTSSGKVTTNGPASADEQSAITLLNPLLHARVSFVARFEVANATSTTILLQRARAAVAAVARVPSTEWVQASLESNTTAGNGTRSSTLHTTVWFPSTDEESSVQRVTDVQRFTTLVLRLPTTAFKQLKNLILNIEVFDVTVSPAGDEAVSANAFFRSTATTAVDAGLQVVAVPASSLPTPATEPFDWSSVADAQPPVIALRGSVYVEVYVGAQYIDPGAAVWDAVDGALTANQSIQLCSWQNWMVTAAAIDGRAVLCNSTVLPAVDTSHATDDEGTHMHGSVYVITYSAADSAGQTAVPVRRFVVVKTRCPKPERWCSSIKACSIMGVCYQSLLSADSFLTRSSPTTTPNLPAEDTLSPRLQLLGTGTAGLTPDGDYVMVNNVEWMSDWKDPGATAVDDVDGNLTLMIQTYGAGAVDTSWPTEPSQKFSYAVQYSVTDTAGNEATALRLIRIACPAPEVYCLDPNMNRPSCTVSGICGAPAVFNANSRGMGSSLQHSTTLLPRPQPPVISLVAAGNVEVPVGFAYERCSSTAPVGQVCEQGATAWDVKDGNLDRQILVCGHRWLPSNQERLVPLHLACGVPTNAPGQFNMTFSVTNSAGLTASVVRRLVLTARCPEGEVPCPDKVSCSVGGTCLGSATWPGFLPTFPSLASVPAATRSINISLVTAPDFGSVVHVKRMTSYLPCREGIRPTTADPCEPGAMAFASGGAVNENGTVMQMDLTAEVVVCPPATCLAGGCSQAELRRHRFAVKGLDGCGHNTAAALGTIFNISFWIWGKHVPAQNATVNRTVIVIEPCPDSTARYLCKDDSSGTNFCSGVPCQQALAMLPPATQPPVERFGQPQIQLLPSDDPLYLEYGQASHVKLQPCKTAVERSSCGAVAIDVVDSEVADDLTPYITVTAGQACGLDGMLGEKVCISCTVEALSAGRGCLPGSYDVVYSVSNDAGMVATATRTVLICQQAQVWAVVPLVRNVANSGSAMVLVRDLRNGVDEAVDTAARSVLYKLGPSGAGWSASDVQVVGAHLRQYAVQNLTVFVNVTVKMYSPEWVRELQNSTASVLNTRRFSRLLQSGLDSSPGPLYVSALLHQVVTILQHLAAGVQSLCTAGGSKNNQQCGMGGSRRLLATASPASTRISALATALTLAAGASDVIVRGTPEVNKMQGYLASLWSSVSTLDQHVSGLLSSGAAIATSLETAYGDTVQQSEASREAQLGSSYQGLVGNWQSLVSNLTSIMDYAVGTSGQQTEANQAVFRVTQESLAAIQDATQLAQRLQEQYAEQELLLTAGNDSLQWSCNRSATLYIHFNVTGSAKSQPAVPSNTSVVPANNDVVQQLPLAALWHGYMVASKVDDTAGVSLTAAGGINSAQPGRFVGALGHNSVVGGLLLHTTRKRLARNCDGNTFTGKFGLICQRQAIPLVKNASNAAEYLSDLFAADSNDLVPYGVDPAFLQSSKLYQPQLQGIVGWFYNLSDPFQVPKSTNIPRGFYHRHLKGYADGFPLLLPNELSAQRSALVLQYLKDGNYLDKDSQGVTADLLTFNADLGLLGVTRVTFQWQKNGIIIGSVDVQSLPAVQRAITKAAFLDPWLVLLWLMTACFVTYTFAAVLAFLRVRESQAIQAMLSEVGLLLDLPTAAMMLAATISLSMYWATTKAASHPQTSYHVYDAITSSAARIFLPAKRYSEAVVLQAEEDDAAVLYMTGISRSNKSSSSSSSWQPLLPGDAGRWLLPDDDHDFDHFAQLLDDVRGLVNLWQQYTLLQGVVLILLTMRLLGAWSFQAKLGIIINTLTTAAPQLTHLLLVISAVLLTFSALVSIAWGSSLEAASSYTSALQETFSTLVGLGTITVWDVVPVSEAATYLQLVLKVVVYYGLVLLFILVLMQYFMAVIGQSFIRLKRDMQRKKARSIAADLAADVLPGVRMLPRSALHQMHELCCGGYSAQRTSLYTQSGRPSSLYRACQLLDLLQATRPQSQVRGSADRSSKVITGTSSTVCDHAVLQQLVDSLLNHSSSSGTTSSSGNNSNAQSARIADSLCAVGGVSGLAAALTAARASKLVAQQDTYQQQPGMSVASPMAPVECQPVAADDGPYLQSSHEPAAEELCHGTVVLKGVRQPGGGQSHQPQQKQQLDRIMMRLQKEMKLHSAIYSHLWNAIHALEQWSTAALRWQHNAAKQSKAFSVLLQDASQQLQQQGAMFKVYDNPAAAESEPTGELQGSSIAGIHQGRCSEVRHTAVLASSLCGVYGSDSSPGGARIATHSDESSDDSEDFVVGDSSADFVAGNGIACVRPTTDVIVSVNSWVHRQGQGEGQG